ncbi:MAG: iron complex outermembrane receptor protein [Rhodothermales bacterium]|jgi:iron complex outermembrane receptor protein
MSAHRLVLALTASLLILQSVPANAQSVFGVVSESDGSALSGVQIVVDGTTRGTVSMEDGQYRLDKLLPGPVRLSFRFIGFRTEERLVEVPSDAGVRLDVVMEAEVLRVDEVVVTAEGQEEAMLKRSTRSVIVLDALALEEIRGQTLGEMLSTLPGVTSLSTGPSISKPVIRGLHSQRVVVLNSGIVQEGQQWGGEHGPEIDPFSPGRIEVIKGAAGVEYGVGAIGGVIRVEPEELPYGQAMSGRLEANAFSNNKQGAGSAMVEGGLLGGAWRAQTSYHRAGDSRTPDHIIRNSGFREWDGILSAGYEGSRVGWRAIASHFGTTLGLYTGAHIGNVDDLLRAIERGEPSVTHDFSYSIDSPKQKIAHDLISLRGHVKLNSGDWIEAQYGFQSNRRSEFDAHARSGDVAEDPAFSLRLATNTLDIKLRTKPRGKWLGVVGVSGMNQANRNQETGLLLPNFSALTGGVFARGSHVSGPLTMEAGGRLDYRWLEAWPNKNQGTGPFVKKTHSWASPSAVLGLIWRFSEHWSLASSAATAWRPPGVNELYNFGVHHGTARFEAGNPDLDAEQSLGWDVTVRHLSESFTVEVSTYVNRMEGFIYLRPEASPRVTIRGTFPSFTYAQTTARLVGLDGSVTTQVGHGIEFSGVLSVVRGQDLDNGEPLLAMPADRLRLGIRKNWGEAFVGLAGTMVARQDRYPEGVDFAEPPAAYSLLSLEAHRTLFPGSTNLHVTMSVDNLLNTSYRDYLSRFRYFIDDPGRTVALRLHLPIGGTS